MIAEHERVVASRFDALHQRFKGALEDEDQDVRLRGILDHLGSIDGCRILDLGCGKGRFSRALQDRGASVIGMDLSAAMLARASGVCRVRASARRLPFSSARFDAVVAVEVFQHLAPASLGAVCAEARRVLRPGGTLVIIDKNRLSWNTQRPWLPSAAVKWIDERRGSWMYSPHDKARERWFTPGQLRRRLAASFASARVEYLLTKAERGRFPFEYLPATRLFVLWSARAPGGDR